MVGTAVLFFQRERSLLAEAQAQQKISNEQIDKANALLRESGEATSKLQSKLHEAERKIKLLEQELIAIRSSGAGKASVTSTRSSQPSTNDVHEIASETDRRGASNSIAASTPGIYEPGEWSKEREWANTDKSKTFRGSLLGVSDDLATAFFRRDGKFTEVPLEKLSKEDQQFIEDAAIVHSEAVKVPRRANLMDYKTPGYQDLQDALEQYAADICDRTRNDTSLVVQQKETEAMETLVRKVSKLEVSIPVAILDIWQQGEVGSKIKVKIDFAAVHPELEPSPTSFIYLLSQADAQRLKKGDTLQLKGMLNDNRQRAVEVFELQFNARQFANRSAEALPWLRQERPPVRIPFAVRTISIGND